MERVNRILHNDRFMSYVHEIEVLEKERIFCRHNMEHFLAVARIGMELSYEEGLTVSKGMLYATALLHDVGRGVQYLTGEEHEVAGSKIATDILKECGYQQEEIEEICEAIAAHRDSSVREEQNLKGLLYRADKLSRGCYYCNAVKECHKADAKKNLKLKY